MIKEETKKRKENIIGLAKQNEKLIELRIQKEEEIKEKKKEKLIGLNGKSKYRSGK
jgi:low affinity Fe/Cu permease